MSQCALHDVHELLVRKLTTEAALRTMRQACKFHRARLDGSTRHVRRGKAPAARSI